MRCPFPRAEVGVSAACTLALALSLSCAPAAAPPAGCGEQAYFDLTGCNRTSIDVIQRDGVWNAQIQWFGGGYATAAFSLKPGEEAISGEPAAEKVSSADTLFLSSPYTADGQSRKLVLMACGATDATHFGGQLAICAEGRLSGLGLFKAAQIRRAAGEAESSKLALVGEAAVSGSPVDVFVAGGFAYVAHGDGATIFDLTDPAHPSPVKELTAAADDFWNRVWVKGDALYVASEKQGILLFDVTQPSNPATVGPVLSDAPDVYSLHVDGDRLFAASPAPKGEVLILNVAAPLTPSLVARFQPSSSNLSLGIYPHHAVSLNDRLYINQWGLGVVVADIANPAAPAQLGQFSYTSATSQTGAAGVFGAQTVVFEGSQGWGGHLRVLDATQPTAITSLAELSLRPEVSLGRVALSGNKLYLAHHQDGIRVVDVSNPAAPAVTGYFNTWREEDSGRGKSFYDGAVAVQVPGDGKVYAVDRSRGLMILVEN